MPLSIDEFAHLTHRLRGRDLRAQSLEEIKKDLRALTDGQITIPLSIDSHEVWFRARKCDSSDGFDSLREMIYPKDGSRSFGRANLPQKPVLYGSRSKKTALDEISADVGDYVQIIEIRVIPGHFIHCILLGELSALSNAGGSIIGSQTSDTMVSKAWKERPQHEVEAAIYVDAFLAEQFARVARRPSEYRMTAVFAEILFDQQRDAVIYPSVESRGGLNLAMKAESFDRSVEVLRSTVYRIDKFHGLGMYDCTAIKTAGVFGDDNRAKAFDVDGTINWQEAPPDDEDRWAWHVRHGVDRRRQLNGWRSK